MVDRKILESIIKEIIAEQLPVPTPQPSVWDKFKTKLSEQGSQRGILAILPLIATQLNLDPADLNAVFAFMLAMIGVHNFITPG